ncbi:MAG: pyridoxal-phosphate dependent enzyme [bacterium]
MNTPHKLDIGFLNTPIKKYSYKGKDFYIKHDEMTGNLLTGNKVRKLDYLLYNAKQNNVEMVLTCGGVQSNHARATVVAASMLGIKSKLYLFGEEPEVIDGNLFIDKIFNAEINYVTEEEYNNIDKILESKKCDLKKAGFNALIIPEGGSSTLGIWGYVNFVSEIKEFVIKNNITGIITAAGSGGTTAGILLGCAINDLPLKVYSVNVLYNKEIINEKVIKLTEECRNEFNIEKEIDFNNFEILDGFSEEGYSNITAEKIDVINDFAKQSGILFDPAYTGKAFYAFVKNFVEKNSDENILFLHSGGLFGIFSKRDDYLKLK